MVALTLLLVLAVRVRLRELPLERDEGEYAYAGQLILQGTVPYDLAYTMKLPGTSAAYALLMAVFGQTTAAIHLGLLLVNAATILLVFLLARKLFDPVAGLAAAASYAVMSMSPSVLGLAAHANHFVVFFALAGACLLLRACEPGGGERSSVISHQSSVASGQVHVSRFTLHASLFAAGLLFGLAFLMKQHGIFYGLFGLVFLLWTGRRPGPADWQRADPAPGARTSCPLRVADDHQSPTMAGPQPKRTGCPRAGLWAAFCAGLALPLTVVCLILLGAGAFRQFVFWTVTYAREYAVAPSLAEGWSNLSGVLPGVIGPNLPLWILSLIGLVLVVVTKPVGRRRFFLAGLLLASALAICPGLCFRPHYFILLLPALAVLAGAALSLTRQLLAPRPSAAVRGLPLVIFALVIAGVVFQQRAPWFTLSPVEVCREIYGHEPFPESVALADYIRQHTAPNDRIAVLGSEPQIYFYAHRCSATGYIYTFPLMESHPFAARMQAAMIREIEQTRPEYVVLIQNTTLWLMRSNSPTRIFEWAGEYLTRYYALDGVADPVARDRTEYRWGAAAAAYKPESEYHTQVYKRLAR